MRSITKRRSFALLGLSASVAALCHPATAFAQVAQSAPTPATDTATSDNGQDIVVTARFRDESAQKIGASVAAVSGDALQARGVNNFEDLARSTAGLQVLKTQPNSNDVSIRGVANAANGAGAQSFTISPLVTTYIDDVSVSSAGGSQRDFSFFDLNRVEVLRGPQPTLFGEGAVGGAVRYFTNDPDLGGATVTGMAHGQVNAVERGKIGYQVANATSFILIPDKLGLRVMGFVRRDGGFIDNPRLGRNDVNTYLTRGGRATLLARPVDNLEIRLSAFIARDKIGEQTQIDPAASPDSLTFNSPLSGTTRDDVDLYSGKVSYDFGAITVSSITGYYTRNFDSSAFNAANTFGLAPFYPGRDTTATGVTRFDEKTLSEELRLVSNFGGPINFVGGFFYKNSDVLRNANVSIPGIATAVVPNTSDIAVTQLSNNVRQYSGFIEATAKLTDRFRIIGGLRYINQTVSTNLDVFSAPAGLSGPPAPIPLPIVNFATFLSGPPFNIGTRFDFQLNRVLPKVALEYDVTDKALFYINAAQGVRSGNLNSPLSAFTAAGGNNARFQQLLRVEADKISSIDAGVKTRWLNDALTVNLGVYYSLYEDPQISVALPTIATLNGPDQHIYGMELESSYRIDPTLTIRGNLALVSAEFQADFRSVLNGPIDIPRGSNAPNQPGVQFSLGYDLNRPLKGSKLALVSNGQFSYVGPRFSLAQNYAGSRLGPLELLNFSLGVDGGAWRLTAYVQNALNDIERVQALVNTLAPTVDAGGRVVNLTRISAAVNQPRTFGLDLTIRY